MDRMELRGQLRAVRYVLALLLLCGCGDDPHGDDPCVESGDRIECPHHTRVLGGDVFGRPVHWKVPAGEPPPGGFPVVVVFQGTAHPADNWTAHRDDLYGGWNGIHLLKALNEQGFIVVAPDAHLDGWTYWDTNIWPFSDNWGISLDNAFVTSLLKGIKGGKFGPADSSRLYATGISSGGYMTSRMAESYRGKFRALAVESASWCTCAGPICTLPSKLPADHPPTLLLHGGEDPIVPLHTMRWYERALERDGIEHQVQVDDKAGHQWLDESAQLIPAWFAAH